MVFAFRTHTKCLRIILSIKWQDTEVLTRAGIPSIHTLLQKAQVRWAGHETRMPDNRLPKQLLYDELCYGKRSVGRQKKRFKDTLKKTLTSFNIDVTNWEVCAQYRPLWRSMIHTGARTAETNRIAEAKKKRAACKARLYSTTSASTGPTYQCPGIDTIPGILINKFSDHQPYFICLNTISYEAPPPKYIKVTTQSYEAISNFANEIINAAILERLNKTSNADPNTNYNILHDSIEMAKDAHLPDKIQ